MIRIYVAGKLNAMAPEYLRNCHKMMRQAERLRKKGFSVFVPCLDLLMGLMTGLWCYDAYFSNSQPWLEVSDAMFVCKGWQGSNGTEKEIARANELGVPIFYEEEMLLKWKEEMDGRPQQERGDRDPQRLWAGKATTFSPLSAAGQLVERVRDLQGGEYRDP
jgi:hypothetical protein